MRDASIWEVRRLMWHSARSSSSGGSAPDQRSHRTGALRRLSVQVPVPCAGGCLWFWMSSIICALVGEDYGSDLFKSDDDDDGCDYVQPTDSSSNDESSDKCARNPPCGSTVPAMTRVPQEATTFSVVPVLVREDCGSDLFESDDDVADHNYVQPSQFTNSNDFRWSLELLHTAIP
ncbi:hypothetical protein O3P69_012491 [Scylla paramamosain]|uniref:Uncharacterized protein n=1 Tax=Scylla paramamosain TaxID=85552 RepID=A0AAW0SCN2_SCYPA